MHNDYQHRPVMLAEVLEGLNVRHGGHYIDGTYGRGGHARAILERLADEGSLTVFDKDPQAIADAQALSEKDSRVNVVHGSFADMQDVLVTKKFDGILLDLGVSSPQLDDAQRGFGFSANGPLDMRMNPDVGQSAAEWLAEVTQETLAHVLREYGEERFAGRIARNIVEAREHEAISTTSQLADIIARSVPKREQHKHPATRSFQAIRIFVNRELEDLDRGLDAALELLAPAGRLAVISFHSLEDRRVKRFMKRHSKGPELPPDLPIMGEPERGPLRIVGKACKPSVAEIGDNPRARSAVLRIAERAA